MVCTVKYFEQPHGTCYFNGCTKPANRIYSYDMGQAWKTFCEDHSPDDIEKAWQEVLRPIELKALFGEQMWRPE